MDVLHYRTSDMYNSRPIQATFSNHQTYTFSNNFNAPSFASELDTRQGHNQSQYNQQITSPVGQAQPICNFSYDTVQNNVHVGPSHHHPQQQTFVANNGSFQTPVFNQYGEPQLNGVQQSLDQNCTTFYPNNHQGTMQCHGNQPGTSAPARNQQILTRQVQPRRTTVSNGQSKVHIISPQGTRQFSHDQQVSRLPSSNQQTTRLPLNNQQGTRKLLYNQQVTRQLSSNQRRATQFPKDQQGTTQPSSNHQAIRLPSSNHQATRLFSSNHQVTRQFPHDQQVPRQLSNDKQGTRHFSGNHQRRISSDQQETRWVFHNQQQAKQTPCDQQRTIQLVRPDTRKTSHDQQATRLPSSNVHRTRPPLSNQQVTRQLSNDQQGTRHHANKQFNNQEALNKQLSDLNNVEELLESLEQNVLQNNQSATKHLSSNNNNVMGTTDQQITSSTTTKHQSVQQVHGGMVNKRMQSSAENSEENPNSCDQTLSCTPHHLNHVRTSPKFPSNREDNQQNYAASSIQHPNGVRQQTGPGTINSCQSAMKAVPSSHELRPFVDPSKAKSAEVKFSMASSDPSASTSSDKVVNSTPQPPALIPVLSPTTQTPYLPRIPQMPRASTILPQPLVPASTITTQPFIATQKAPEPQQLLTGSNPEITIQPFVSNSAATPALKSCRAASADGTSQHNSQQSVFAPTTNLQTTTLTATTSWNSISQNSEQGLTIRQKQILKSMSEWTKSVSPNFYSVLNKPYINPPKANDTSKIAPELTKLLNSSKTLTASSITPRTSKLSPFSSRLSTPSPDSVNPSNGEILSLTLTHSSGEIFSPFFTLPHSREGIPSRSFSLTYSPGGIPSPSTVPTTAQELRIPQPISRIPVEKSERKMTPPIPTFPHTNGDMLSPIPQTAISSSTLTSQTQSTSHFSLTSPPPSSTPRKQQLSLLKPELLNQVGFANENTSGSPNTSETQLQTIVIKTEGEQYESNNSSVVIDLKSDVCSMPPFVKLDRGEITSYFSSKKRRISLNDNSDSEENRLAKIQKDVKALLEMGVPDYQHLPKIKHASLEMPHRSGKRKNSSGKKLFSSRRRKRRRLVKRKLSASAMQALLISDDEDPGNSLEKIEDLTSTRPQVQCVEHLCKVKKEYGGTGTSPKQNKRARITLPKHKPLRIDLVYKHHLTTSQKHRASEGFSPAFIAKNTKRLQLLRLCEVSLTDIFP